MKSETQATLRPRKAAAQKPDEIDLGHLDHVLGYVLRRAQIAVFKDFRRTFARFDISPTQYAVLSVLADHPGLRQGDVSVALGIKRANFVAVLDELERRGLARHVAVENDRRSRTVMLTEAGAAITADIRALHANNEARYAALLPAGKHAEMIAMLQALTHGIEPDEA